ncbi:MAG: (deoxy)nucleoside triphosphate pyrophosphohydrolase [Deltaproteobacteria bacterium]|nr:(deoxy)nucleoside triphosphate pyrophosphohydrolase [Deltaproteobacteria bacterium]
MEVSAAIITNDNGELLICRRGPGGNCACLWEFPGGKRESGESLRQCLVRECLEELSVDIAVLELFEETFHSYPGGSIKITFFNARIISGQPQALVHSEIKWVRPDALSNLDFCPGDQPVVALLAAKAAARKRI